MTDLLHESILQVVEGLAMRIEVVTGPGSGLVEPPGRDAFVEGTIEKAVELGDVRGIGEAYERLDTAIEIAVHHVGTTYVQVSLTRVPEKEDPRMLEEAAQDASNPYRFAESRDSRTQCTDPPHPEIDTDPFLRCSV